MNLFAWFLLSTYYMRNQSYLFLLLAVLAIGITCGCTFGAASFKRRDEFQIRNLWVLLGLAGSFYCTWDGDTLILPQPVSLYSIQQFFMATIKYLDYLRNLDPVNFF